MLIGILCMGIPATILNYKFVFSAYKLIHSRKELRTRLCNLDLELAPTPHG